MISNVWTQAIVQTSSIDTGWWRDEIKRDLKPIYTAVDTSPR